MDIEEMGLRLAMAYDKIRASNTDIKNEADGLKGELNTQLSNMDQELEMEKTVCGRL